MSTTHFDILIIGSGPGGEKAAIQASKAGKSVAIIEKDKYFGGNCVFHGTIPSKTLREAALTIHSLKRSAPFLDYKLREDIEVSTLMNRLNSVLDAQKTLIQHQLDSNNITQVHGRASFINKNTIEVFKLKGNVENYTADQIIIATGSRPRLPSDIAIDHEYILDSDSILSMIYIPQSLVILGGGVIACEYASIFMELGTKVTLIDNSPIPLSFIDSELVESLLKHFERGNCEFIGSTKVESINWDGLYQVETKLSNGRVIHSDKALFALGRVANVELLKLENVGIELSSRNNILVNENYQTNIPNIYAIGDVIGFPSLASTSMEQGRRAAGHIINLESHSPFSNVPIGIYTVPEISSIGLSEFEAKEQGIDFVVGKADFSEIARGMISGIQDGFLKLVAERSTLKIIGCQIIGDGACDLIHVAEMAMINGNDITVFLDNVLNFPTLGEAYRVAAFNLYNKTR